MDSQSMYSERVSPTSGRAGYTDGIVPSTIDLNEPQGKFMDFQSVYSEHVSPTNGRAGYTDGIVPSTIDLNEPQGKLKE